MTAGQQTTLWTVGADGIARFSDGEPLPIIRFPVWEPRRAGAFLSLVSRRVTANGSRRRAPKRPPAVAVACAGHVPVKPLDTVTVDLTAGLLATAKRRSLLTGPMATAEPVDGYSRSPGEEGS